METSSHLSQEDLGTISHPLQHNVIHQPLGPNCTHTQEQSQITNTSQHLQHHNLSNQQLAAISPTLHNLQNSSTGDNLHINHTQRTSIYTSTPMDEKTKGTIF